MEDFRKIIHIDMDAFYAAVEMRDDPALRHVPLVVGGSPFSRGVVSTANYEARKYGIHSAMPTYHAYKLCPHAVFIKPRFQRYQEVSSQIRQIFRRYTSKIEPLSLDEAFLDVTQSELRAVQIAQAVRRDILTELGLTASAGVSINKLTAKVASDHHKPNGITIVLPEQVKDFIGMQKVRKIPGVGPKMEQRLHDRGIRYCRDAWAFTQDEFSQEYGKWGADLWQRFHGIDHRQVEISHQRKSLGQERTFATDLTEVAAMHNALLQMAEETLDEIVQRNLEPKTLTIKVKYNDFMQVTRACSLAMGYVQGRDQIAAIIKTLLLKTECESKPVRLLGVSYSGFFEAETEEDEFPE